MMLDIFLCIAGLTDTRMVREYASIVEHKQKLMQQIYLENIGEMLMIICGYVNLVIKNMI